MNASLQNLITITTELQAQGIKPTVTVLKPRRAKASELVMSMTKGVRTNTNRRGQAYNGHATTATESSVEGNRAAYFKTSGWYTHKPLTLISNTMTQQQFFVSFLYTYGETGNDILRLLDEIEQGQVEFFGV